MKNEFVMLDKFSTMSEEELQSVSGGSLKQAASLTQTMAAGASFGAAAGSFIPVVGTGAGAIFGGMLGTIGWAIAYKL